MGCDIHPAVEVRRQGVWRHHRPKTECPYYYEYHYDHSKTPPEKVWDLDADGNRVRSRWDNCKTRLDGIFENRNYSTFSMLANVRNDGSIAYIQEYRGLPSNISKGALMHTGTEDDPDLHSHGWVTLQELKDYHFTELIEDYNGEVQPIGCYIPVVQMVQYMEKLIPKGGTTEDVRLVFSFDN